MFRADFTIQKPTFILIIWFSFFFIYSHQFRTLFLRCSSGLQSQDVFQLHNTSYIKIWRWILC